MNPLTLFYHASWMVQLVMLTLFSLSLLSWALMFADYRRIRNTKRRVLNFFDDFWSASSVDALYQREKACEEEDIAATLFCAGYQTSQQTPHALENVERRMQIIQNDALAALSSRLHWLATISHVSPYIGLLGTVCGIIHTFQSLSISQQATLATVAPGISEALVTTAMALMVAIPAAVTYNRMTAWIEQMDDKLTGLQSSLIFTLAHHAQTQ